MIFGNPLVARTMVREDVKAGLFAPVSMLVEELAGDGDGRGKVSVMWDLPSSLVNWEATVKGASGERLREASEVLDGKMKRFIEDLGRTDEEWEGIVREKGKGKAKL